MEPSRCSEDCDLVAWTKGYICELNPWFMTSPKQNRKFSSSEFHIDSSVWVSACNSLEGRSLYPLARMVALRVRIGAMLFNQDGGCLSPTWIYTPRSYQNLYLFDQACCSYRKLFEPSRNLSSIPRAWNAFWNFSVFGCTSSSMCICDILLSNYTFLAL